MKLQARLAIAVALAAAFAIVSMAAAFWVLSANSQRSIVDDGLLAVAGQPRSIVDAAFDGDVGVGRAGRPGQRGLGALAGAFAPDEGGSADDRFFNRARIVFEGQTILDQGLPEIEVQQGDEPILSTIEIDGERYRMVAAPLQTQRRAGTIQVARNIEDLEGGLNQLRQRIVAASLAGIVLAALLGALVARRLSAPIAEVANAAKAMTFGSDMPSPIEVNRTDEVGDLASSFNQMLSALELSRDQQHRLVADASHELRTPLTSLGLKLDLLDSTPDLPAETRQELLASSAIEVCELGELVTELVVLATDPSGVEEEVAEHSLSDLVREVAEQHETRTGRSVIVAGGENATARPIRLRMVRRAISNLIDNALKYSTGNSPVTVTVAGDKIEVRDQGEGIPADDLDYVFDRFFRSATARTRPGNGIGLAIVQRVAELHNGETWARNATDPSGAIVGFSVGDPVD